MPPPPTPPRPSQPQAPPPPKQRPAAARPPIPILETYAEHGDVVEWYSGADRSQQPYCAVVTKVGMDASLTVNRLSPDLCDTTPQDGCRHIDDPKAQFDAYSGGWRHRRITLGVRSMLLKIGLLKWEFDREWKLAFNPEAIEAPAAPAAPATPAQ